MYMGRNCVGHNYVGHNCTGHNYMDHNYTWALLICRCNDEYATDIRAWALSIYWGVDRDSLNPKYTQPKNPFELIYSLN